VIQAEVGNVSLLEVNWIEAFLAEAVPNHATSLMPGCLILIVLSVADGQSRSAEEERMRRART
jgi:hypothetical protein